MDVSEFARRLKEVRGERTQRELGNLLGVDQMRVSRWERAACTPSLRFWRLLNEQWPEQFPLAERPKEVPTAIVPTRRPQRARRGDTRAPAKSRAVAHSNDSTSRADGR
jgi:transcriptional regulator with XRE-family HTH domain